MGQTPHRNDRAADRGVEGATDRPEEHVDVVVIGAGLAGLTAANVAADGGARVAVLDQRRPGGRAATTVVEPGAVFNSGPRALYRGGAAARVLAALAIEPRGGIAPSEGHGVRDGRVHELPTTAFKLLRSPLLSAGSKVKLAGFLGGLARLDAAKLDDWSLERWLSEHRLAPDARELVRATVRTVTYVDDLELSAGTAVRQLQLGLGRGNGVTYLDGGWQQLVDALLDRLAGRGVEVLTGLPARAVQPAAHPADGWRVELGDRTLLAAAVVVAAGGPDAAEQLLPVPLDRSGLGPPATAACLELAVRRPPRTRFLLGIGDPLYLSDHSAIARLAPDDLHVVHVMRYGARTSAEDRAALWAHAAAAGIRRDDVVAQRFLHSMTVMGGIPTGAGGGQAGRPPVQVRGATGLFVAGDWVGDEGLLGDAAVASGERAGRLASELARRAPAEAVLSG